MIFPELLLKLFILDQHKTYLQQFKRLPSLWIGGGEHVKIYKNKLKWHPKKVKLRFEYITHVL